MQWSEVLQKIAIRGFEQCQVGFVIDHIHFCALFPAGIDGFQFNISVIGHQERRDQYPAARDDCADGRLSIRSSLLPGAAEVISLTGDRNANDGLRQIIGCVPFCGSKPLQTATAEQDTGQDSDENAGG